MANIRWHTCCMIFFSIRLFSVDVTVIVVVVVVAVIVVIVRMAIPKTFSLSHLHQLYGVSRYTQNCRNLNIISYTTPLSLAGLLPIFTISIYIYTFIIVQINPIGIRFVFFGFMFSFHNGCLSNEDVSAERTKQRKIFKFLARKKIDGVSYTAEREIEKGQQIHKLSTKKNEIAQNELDRHVSRITVSSVLINVQLGQTN